VGVAERHLELAVRLAADLLHRRVQHRVLRLELVGVEEVVVQNTSPFAEVTRKSPFASRVIRWTFTL